MKFNKGGSLTEWSKDSINIIPQLILTKENKLRGGAFLCLPNFDELPEPFTHRHGEYRITKGEESPQQMKIIESESENGWGSLSTETKWSELQTAPNHHQLIITSTLTCLSDYCHLRPGFHPYFSPHGEFVVTLQKPDSTLVKVNKITLRNDSPNHQRVISPNNTAVAEISTDRYSLSVTAQVLNWKNSSPATFSFTVWSDDKEKYVCVEPSLGVGSLDSGLPGPFTLARGESITLAFTIDVTTH